MQTQTPSVGIIGGGLAGIYTAHLLAQHDIAFKIIEAKSHLGGRIYGENTSSTGYKIDLGPSWIFPHQEAIQALVKSLGLALHEQFAQGDAIFQQSTNAPVQQISGVAPPPMYRIAGGTSKLIDALLATLDKPDIDLSSPVHSCSYNGSTWRINEQSTQFSHLVVAIPPRLMTNKLQIEEDARCSVNEISTLFQSLDTKFKQTPTWMAAQAKFAITFDTPFWRERGLSGQAFSHVGPMGEIHDACFEDKNGHSVFALFGFIGLPFQHRSQVSQAEIETACLSQLRILFGEDVSKYKLTYYKDWGDDIFAATTLDQQQASMHPHIALENEQKTLSRINLHFSTSEFSAHEAGYMEGAILASQQTAAQIISTLK